MIYRIQGIVDYFLPEKSPAETTESQFRAKILIVICLAMSALLLLACIVFVLFVNQDMFRRLLNLLILLPLAAAFISIIALLRFTGKQTLCSHLLISIVFIGIMGGMTITGGPLYSSTAASMVIPPILAFCLLGKRSGLIWTILAFVGMSILCFLDGVIGINFIHTANPDTEDINRFFDWSIAFTVIIAIVFSYEQLTSRLNDKLLQEKQKFHHQARHDYLTGLPNRNFFYERMERAMVRRKEATPLMP